MESHTGLTGRPSEARRVARRNDQRGIGRILDIIRRIAAAPEGGASLAAIARETGLPKPSIHRRLGELQAEGWIDRDPATKTYFLGMEMRVLGDLARRRHRLVDLAAVTLSRIADATGQTTYLLVRRGIDALCVARQEGSAPVRAVTLDIGMLRPLGMGAGPTALLAGLDDAEVAEIIEHHGSRRELRPAYSADAARAAVEFYRRNGHARHDGMLVPGLGGLGLAIRGPSGQVEGAVSIAFVSAQFDEMRRVALLATMREAVHALERRFAADRRLA